MNNNEASLKAQIQQKDVLIQIQNTKIQQQDIDIKKMENVFQRRKIIFKSLISLGFVKQKKRTVY